MTQLLYNNNFAIAGTGPNEPADEWRVTVANSGSAIRTTSVVAGITPNPSGNADIIEIHSASNNINSVFRQINVPFVSGQNYTFTCNLYITANSTLIPKGYVVRLSGSRKSGNLPATGNWYQISIPFLATSNQVVEFVTEDPDQKSVFIDNPSILACDCVA